MKVIKGVLKEELNNSLRMKKDYQRELAKLPKGSLVKKKIRGKEYYYLVLREKGRVKFIYKGKLSADEIKKYRQTKEYRAKYRKLISELNRQIKFLKGTLRGKKSV
jgi:hypothetical protein